MTVREVIYRSKNGIDHIAHFNDRLNLIWFYDEHRHFFKKKNVPKKQSEDDLGCWFDFEGSQVLIDNNGLFNEKWSPRAKDGTLPKDYIFAFDNTKRGIWITPKKYFEETGYVYDCHLCIDNILPCELELASENHYFYTGRESEIKQIMQDYGFVYSKQLESIVR